MRYLGLYLDKQLNFSHHAKLVIDSLYGHLCTVSKILANHPCELNPATIISIYKARSRSKMEYALIFYQSKNIVQRLQKIQNKFIRLALQCSRHSSLDIIQLIMHVEPVRFRVIYLQMRFYVRFMYAESYHLLFNHRQQLMNLSLIHI